MELNFKGIIRQGGPTPSRETAEIGDTFYDPVGQLFCTWAGADADFQSRSVMSVDLSYPDDWRPETDEEDKRVVSDAIFSYMINSGTDGELYVYLLNQETGYGPVGTVIYFDIFDPENDGCSMKVLTVMNSDDLIFKPKNILEVLQAMSADYTTNNIMDALMAFLRNAMNMGETPIGHCDLDMEVYKPSENGDEIA